MTSVLDLIGETPLVEVTRLDCGGCRLFLKLESANPSGSLKDRPARAMVEAAEAEGRLKDGGTIVEATAGNTGLGLALVGGRKGYRTLLVVPDNDADSGAGLAGALLLVLPDALWAAPIEVRKAVFHPLTWVGVIAAVIAFGPAWVASGRAAALRGRLTVRARPLRRAWEASAGARRVGKPKRRVRTGRRVDGGEAAAESAQAETS